MLFDMILHFLLAEVIIMAEQTLARLENILDHLERLDPEARITYLEKLAQDHPEWLEDARRLLHGIDGDDSFLDREAFPDFSQYLLSSGLLEVIPLDLEGYRILDLLGEGGMGRVYLAYQGGPVSRKVALKVMSLGLTSPGALARFEFEALALARLNHPAIARIYDVGKNQTGMHFFTMEYFPGEAITTYCERENLTVQQRIHLFLDVCGISHVHLKGLIHRDLKPSNILVRQQSGTAQVKLIDFGIARSMAVVASDATLAGGHGILGTLAYMSPEQTLGPDGDLDSRCDIYSACSVLYEMLAGRPPLLHADLGKHNVEEGLRLIRDVDPPLLSQVAQQGEHFESLRRELKGDLDWILAKGLRKNPEHRYRNIDDLGADLQNYLMGRPVMAAPPTRLYQLSKFVKRHRLSISAALFCTCLLILTSVISFLSLFHMRESRDQAQHQLKRFQAVNSFLTEVLSRPDPFQKKARGNLLLVDALEEIGRQVNGSFEDVPEIRANIHTLLGRTYKGLADLENSERHLLSALKDSELIYLPGDSNNQNLRFELAQLYFLHDRWEQAKSWLGQAGQYPISEPLRFRMETLHGHLLRKSGKLEQCRKVYEKLLAQHPYKDEDYVEVLRGLANSYYQEGSFETSAQLFEQVLRDQKLIYGDEESHEILQTCNNLANVYTVLGNLARAEEMHRMVLRIRTIKLGAKHPSTLISQHNLGLLLMAEEKFEDSEVLLGQTADLFEQVSGPDHPNTLIARNNQGRAIYAQGQYKRAEELFRTWWMRAGNLPYGDPGTRWDLGENLARTFLKQNKPGASKLLTEILRQRREQGKSQTGNLIHTRLLLGRALLTEDPGKAADLFRKNLDQAEDILSSSHPNRLLSEGYLGYARWLQGQHEAGLEILERAYLSLPVGSERGELDDVFRRLGRAPPQFTAREVHPTAP